MSHIILLIFYESFNFQINFIKILYIENKSLSHLKNRCIYRHLSAELSEVKDPANK